MSGDVVIRAEGLGKKYVIGHESERERYTALRDVLIRTARDAWRRTADMARGRAIVAGDITEEFWALRDVGFEVRRGEVLGIIGRNGAGKSTLLKILSRITEPSAGRVTIEGRVASLLEVGTGFHPELTGRENIYLNGAILGMTQAEIRRKFDEIVAFAEVERFLDTPVKRYSSGMYVRLAFAVAAHLEPEIMVVDEVLAVGDAEFQKKCLGKMSDVAKGGRTVLFVSHNMGAVRSLTETCLYLESGRVVDAGETNAIVETYLARSVENKIGEDNLDFFRREKNNGSPVSIRSICLGAGNHGVAVLPSVPIGAPFVVQIDVASDEVINSSHVTIGLRNATGDLVATICSLDGDFDVRLLTGPNTITARISELSLVPGRYFVDVGIGSNVATRAFDVILGYPLFDVVNTGQVSHWLNRPWGHVHCHAIAWGGSQGGRSRQSAINASETMEETSK